MAPHFLTFYVKSNKNDANDAEAICQWMVRPGMCFVAVKTVEQQDIQAVHRIPARLGTKPTRKRSRSGRPVR
jgi:transposase